MRSALAPSCFWKAELALPASYKPCNLIHQVGLWATQIHERSFVKANEAVKKGEVVGMEEAKFFRLHHAAQERRCISSFR
jgi:hypothetical protein